MMKETGQGLDQRSKTKTHSSREQKKYGRSKSRFLLAEVECSKANESPAGEFFGLFFSSLKK
ncbi:MAG: hypothetical protein U5K69_01080 [Balneolaceae bacterium]|nr:hypothetical protein [Balneolaceae bacterium]